MEAILSITDKVWSGLDQGATSTSAQSKEDWQPFWVDKWPSNQGLAAILSRNCLIMIAYAVSMASQTRLTKTWKKGSYLYSFWGIKWSWADQPAQNQFFLVDLQKSQLIPSRMSINRAEIPYSLSVLTDHSFWWHLSSRAKKPGGLAPLCKNR